MIYTPEEEKFILKLAEAWEAKEKRLRPEVLRDRLGFDPTRFESVARSLGGKDLFKYGRTQSGEIVITPEQRSVEVARDIMARRAAAEAEAADLVAGVEARARRHKYLAPLIVAIRATGPVVGLVGGVCGIVALLLRGC